MQLYQTKSVATRDATHSCGKKLYQKEQFQLYKKNQLQLVLQLIFLLDATHVASDI
jgi:hypothetical protein